MKNYRDLEIYKLAKKLALEIHKMTLALPKFELYEEGSQIRRSSKAIGANLHKFMQIYKNAMKNIEFMKVHEQASVAVVGASNKKSKSITEEI